MNRGRLEATAPPPMPLPMPLPARAATDRRTTDDAPGCGIVGCSRRARFAFSRAEGPTALRCWWHGPVYAPVLRQALRVAAVVGTVLFAINQGDVVLRGHLTAAVAGKIGLTYLVPFCVSTYSALGVNRLRPRPLAQVTVPEALPTGLGV